MKKQKYEQTDFYSTWSSSNRLKKLLELSDDEVIEKIYLYSLKINKSITAVSKLIPVSASKFNMICNKKCRITKFMKWRLCYFLDKVLPPSEQF